MLHLTINDHIFTKTGQLIEQLRALPLERKVRHLNLGPVKLGAVSPTAVNNERSCVAQAQ